MLQPIVPPLLDWYDRCARDLPWRRTRDPYAIWLSEIMCQQTRVQAVIGYYHRFLAELPTVRALAEADEERLFKLWEGLGYYSRAKNLQKAARLMVDRYGGELPQTFEGLCSLPGVGVYTAGAIGSIAFGLRVPCIDGNVLRVITRVTNDQRMIDRGNTRSDITAAVSAILPQDRPGDFNQALMELGATVCLPNGEPLCSECPLAALCEGNLQGTAQSLPRKSPKKQRRVEERTVFLLYCGGRVALRKRPPEGLLANLWEFPTVTGQMSPDEASDFLLSLGLRASKLNKGPKAKHIFSHVEWHMTSLEGEVEFIGDLREDLVWADAACLSNETAVASAFKVYKQHVLEILSEPSGRNEE